jgi:hypothetical protein
MNDDAGSIIQESNDVSSGPEHDPSSDWSDAPIISMISHVVLIVG